MKETNKQPDTPRGMTATELQGIVRIVANNTFCRYWMDYRRTEEGHQLMAISAIDEKGNPNRFNEKELLDRGFEKRIESDGLVFWVVLRLDDHGQPFKPTLPPG